MSQLPGFFTIEKTTENREQHVHCFPAVSPNCLCPWWKEPCITFTKAISNTTDDDAMTVSKTSLKEK